MWKRLPTHRFENVSGSHFLVHTTEINLDKYIIILIWSTSHSIIVCQYNVKKEKKHNGLKLIKFNAFYLNLVFISYLSYL